MTKKFENNKLRIGPPSYRKDLFLMPGSTGKMRKGKKWEIPEYFSKLGLNAYEFSAGRMANFSDNEKYQKFRPNTEKFDIAMSIHAPYYISLTSTSDETYEKSIERVAKVYAWATYLNAKRIVVHPGSYAAVKQRKNKDLRDLMGTKPKSTNFDEQVKILIDKIVNGITKGRELSYEMFPDIKDKFKEICICPETMGKLGQLGTVKEVIDICKKLGTDIARPCIDFGHLYARHRGKWDERKMYENVFNEVETELGTEVMKNLHIHYSHIAFTEKGEDKHVPNTNTEWGPNIQPLFKIIKEQDLTPIIINESPDLEPDAKILMDKWKTMK